MRAPRHMLGIYFRAGEVGGQLIADALALPSAGHGVACGCIRVMPYSRYMQWPLR